ncbi:MAG: hypothetical protein AAFS06_19275 [Cyanobacteria bacterium J06631_12]
MKLAEQSDSEILKVANPIMNNLMEASTDIDFEKHTKDFSDRIKKNFTKEDFQKQCQGYQSKLGIFADREFMGTTRHDKLVNVYWKQRLSKTEDEFLATLSLSQQGSRYVVERAYVDLWRLEKQ